MTIDLQLPKTQCIHVVYWFGLLGSPKVKPAQHTSSTAPGFWRKVANLTGRVKTCYLKWGMLIVAFFLKSTGAGFWWAWTASWHGIVTSHSWGWCPGFVKPRGPPNWTHFALRRSLAWSLMEKGVTVGSSLSGTKRGKCFLLASVVVRFEWHSSDGDFSLCDQIHGWFPGQGNCVCHMDTLRPDPGRQPMIDLNPRFKRFFCSSWSSKRGRDWKCRPNQSIPKLCKDFGDRKQLLPSIWRASVSYQSLQGTNFIPGMREVWKEVICVVIV